MISWDARQFGSRLRRRRRDLGWSVSELSKRAGYSRTTVTRAESGDNVGLHAAVSLCIALGLPLEQLGKPEATEIAI